MSILQEKLASGVAEFHKSHPFIEQGLFADFKDLWVVIEFECYLTVEAEKHDEYREFISPQPDQYTVYIRNYFVNGSVALRKINGEYEDWRKDRLEKYVAEYLKTHQGKESYPVISRHVENLRADDLSKIVFFEHFGNLKTLTKKFDTYPMYGWVTDEDDYLNDDFYSSFGQYNDYENDDEILEYLARDSFFKGNAIADEVSYKNPKYWYLEPDPSMKKELDENQIAVEIVTPWISGDKVISVVDRFKKFYDHYDGQTEATTGGHINIRFKKETSINLLKLVLLSQDLRDLHIFKRQLSRFAKPLLNKIRRNLSHSVGEEISLNNIKKIRSQLEIFLEFNKEKFDAINFIKFFDDIDEQGMATHRTGFVEFRIPGSDYLDGGFEAYKKAIRKYMTLMLVADQRSNLFEKEYHIRIVRLINQLTQRNADSFDARNYYSSAIYYLNRKLNMTNIMREMYFSFRKIHNNNNTYSYVGVSSPELKQKDFPTFVDEFLNVINLSKYNIWFGVYVYKLVTIKPLNRDKIVESLTRTIKKSIEILGPSDAKKLLMDAYSQFLNEFPDKRAVYRDMEISLLKLIYSELEDKNHADF